MTAVKERTSKPRKETAGKGPLPRRRWANWQLCVPMLAINLLAYSNSFKTGWHFDDGPNVFGNPDVQIFDLSWSSLARAASSSPGGKRPVSYLSFALNYYLFGEDAFSFHVVNFLIHGLNTFFVFKILSKLFAIASRDGESARVLSAVTTALWSLNPLQTQAVIYVVQRMMLLSCLFSLLSFYFFMQWRSAGRGKWYPALSLFSWLLAIGSKENAFLLPLTFVAYEWLFTDRRLLRPRNLASGLAVFLCLAGFIVKRYDLVKRIEVDYSQREFTMTERLLTQPRVVTFHLSQLAAPLPSRLALRHEVEKSVSLTTPPTTMLSILFLGALFSVGWLVRRKEPLICFGMMWFFLNLVVESSFLPLELIYEHRVYLPSVGLFLALGRSAEVALARWLPLPSTSLVYCFALLIACSCSLAFVRNQAWQDEVSLWADNVGKYPSSFRAWNNLGTAYAKSGRTSDAEQAFRKALETAPQYPPARVNLAVLLKDQGRLADAHSLIEDFRETQIGTFSAEVYYNMGAIFASKGVMDQAFFHYGQAVHRLPNYAEAHFNLALLYRRAGKKPEAKQSFQRFLEHWRGPSDSPFVAEAKISISELDGRRIFF